MHRQPSSQLSAITHPEEETLSAKNTCILLRIKGVIYKVIAVMGHYRQYLTSVGELLRGDANDCVRLRLG